MFIRTSKVTSDGQITIPAEYLEKMNLSADDHVAFIFEDNRLILRKLTSGEGQMTYDEFILYRDTQIRSKSHEKITRLFYTYLGSVTGNSQTFTDLFSYLLNVDFPPETTQSACFNGIFDRTEPPYDNVDLYVKFSNDICVYVYGAALGEQVREMKENEYAIIVLSENLGSSVERKADRHIYIH